MSHLIANRIKSLYQEAKAISEKERTIISDITAYRDLCLKSLENAKTLERDSEEFNKQLDNFLDGNNNLRLILTVHTGVGQQFANVSAKLVELVSLYDMLEDKEELDEEMLKNIREIEEVCVYTVRDGQIKGENSTFFDFVEQEQKKKRSVHRESDKVAFLNSL